MLGFHYCFAAFDLRFLFFRCEISGFCSGEFGGFLGFGGFGGFWIVGVGIRV